MRPGKRFAVPVRAHEARHADVALFDEPSRFRVYADDGFLIGHQSGCPIGSVAEDDGHIRRTDIVQAWADFRGHSVDKTVRLAEERGRPSCADK